MSSPENPIYRLFPGKALCDFAPAAAAIGFAEQTARDLVWRGKFPVQTVKVGRKRLVVVEDLARHYAEIVGLATDTHREPQSSRSVEPAPRKPGRPRKVAAQEGGAQ